MIFISSIGVNNLTSASISWYSNKHNTRLYTDEGNHKDDNFFCSNFCASFIYILLTPFLIMMFSVIICGIVFDIILLVFTFCKSRF